MPTSRHSWATRGRWRARHSSAILTAIITQSAISGASPLVELELDAPPGCPAPAMVQRAIEHLVQHPPAAPVRVVARLVPLPDHWQLRASFENGMRMVDGDTCTSVAEALVVMVALAIDPIGKLDESVFHEFELEEPPPPPPAASAPGSSVASDAGQGAQPARSAAAPSSLSASKQQTSAARSAAPWMSAFQNVGSARGDTPVPNGGPTPARPTESAKVGVTLSLLTASGLLPDWSLGPSGAVHYGHRRQWVELSASGLLPRFKSVGNGSAIGGTIGWFAAQAGGCALPVRNVPLGGCLAAEFGDLLGRGERVAHRHVAYAFVPALSAAVVWHARIHGDFGLDARLGLAVLWIRPQLGLQGYGLVFQPDPVSWRAAIGFSWR